MNDIVIQQRGARGDRAVAIGAFLAFLVTGFFGEEPSPAPASAAAEARMAEHAPPLRR